MVVGVEFESQSVVRAGHSPGLSVPVGWGGFVGCAESLECAISRLPGSRIRSKGGSLSVSKGTIASRDFGKHHSSPEVFVASI